MTKAVVFAYHNVGVRCLSVLLAHDIEVALVVTHQDNPDEAIWFDSVAGLAALHGIPAITPADPNDPAIVASIAALAPDFLFSFYYRQMLKGPLLAVPARGAYNMHGSLLPKYRGRVPVNWAVINGETETGATLHYMVAKPDAGDIVDREKVPIAFTDTAFDVFNKVTDAAATVIRRAWPMLLAGTAERIPMDLAAGSYFGGRKPADGLIDWTKGATQIYNLIRGVTHPYPGAFTHLDGKKVVIWQAWPVEGIGEPGCIVSAEPLLVGTGAGLLEVRSLQMDGEDEISARRFAESFSLDDKSFTNP